MPKATNHSALVRQWEMLRLIPARTHGSTTAAELTRRLCENGYKVHKRTIERDLNTLSAVFGLDADDNSPQGWRRLPGPGWDIDGIDIPDAVSLVLSQTMLEQLLPASMLGVFKPRFEKARAVLASASAKNHAARWPEKVRYIPATMGLPPPVIAPAVITALHEALVKELQVEVDYLPPNGKKLKALRLHPLGLILRGVTPYLVATAYDYDDPRLYALHRIYAPRLTTDKVNAPAGYTLDSYLQSSAMEFGAGQPIKLEAWVHDELAAYLTETPLSKDQSPLRRKQGRYRLTATVRDSWQLRWWILSQGPAFTVLSPKSLRKEIAETLSSARENYR